MLMIAYLIESEEQQQVDRDEQKSKDLILATNPELYLEMWPPEGAGLSPEEEDDIDFIIPESEGDVQVMMAELRKAGWNG